MRHPQLAGGNTDFGRDYYAALAALRIGLTPSNKNYGFLWEDFDKANTAGGTASGIPGWDVALAGTGGTLPNVAGTKGGVHRLTTGATAAASADMEQKSFLVGNISTDKWWLGQRSQISAKTVQVRAVCGLYDSGNAKSVTIGVWGTGAGGGAATNFSLQYDGNLGAGVTWVDTGVAIDASMHVFELYCKGDSKVYYRIDEGTEASVTPAAASVLSHRIYWSTRNGTDNVAYLYDRDFIGCLYPR